MCFIEVLVSRVFQYTLQMLTSDENKRWEYTFIPQFPPSRPLFSSPKHRLCSVFRAESSFVFLVMYPEGGIVSTSINHPQAFKVLEINFATKADRQKIKAN